jgi:AraC-like DNA-binding protein
MTAFDRGLMDTFEKHWTVKELAAHWRLSPCSIRRLFEDEPGVAFLGRGKDGCTCEAVSAPHQRRVPANRQRPPCRR